jgi:hypothetical protein
MDPRRLRIGELALGLAGAALLVSLFLPWYGDRSGWESLSVVDLLLALIAVSVLAVPFVTAAQPVAAVPVALQAISTLLGMVALLLVLLRVLDLPGDAGGRAEGLWLALAAAAGVMAAGALAMRDERLSPPERPTDATGKPIDRRREIEALPAPPRGTPQ